VKTIVYLTYVKNIVLEYDVFQKYRFLVYTKNMELNIITILYLFFRLAPFIIVSYFSISSLFNQDIKGVIYLVGVIIACFATVLIGNSLSDDYVISTQQNPVCNMLTIGSTGTYSRIPLGISIMSYTLIYLVYVIAKYKMEMYNLPTLILFPMLILGDVFWNVKNGCFQPFGIFLSIIIGGSIGALWALIIDSIKQPKLQYFNVGSDKTVCQRPSKQLFKCTFKS
jgi:hypothetical protein